MELLGKKLTLKKTFEDICEVLTYTPSQSVHKLGQYQINIPGVGPLILNEKVIRLLFDVIEQKKPQEIKEEKKPVKPNLEQARNDLMSLKKDDLLKVVSDMKLEDDIASSLKKALLVEEILKEKFGEDYKAKG
tara:strand:- start:12485 stop:12883 length:399 start_codon:yes stop_codon:yes gene_type:complete